MSRSTAAATATGGAPLLDITEWGKRFWAVAHAYSMTYPDDPSCADRRFAHTFFTYIFQQLIPCQATCRPHWDTHVARHPPATQSRRALAEWVIDAHNRVNRSKGTRSDYTYDEVAAMYWGAGNVPEYIRSDPARHTSIPCDVSYTLGVAVACALAAILIGWAVTKCHPRRS